MFGEVLRFICVYYDLKQKQVVEWFDIFIFYLFEIEKGYKMFGLELIWCYLVMFGLFVFLIMFFVESVEEGGVYDCVCFVVVGKLLGLMQFFEVCLGYGYEDQVYIFFKLVVVV